MTSHTEILASIIDARHRISRSQHWTKGAQARDISGRISYDDDDNFSYCAVGAFKSRTVHDREVHHEAYLELETTLGGRNLVDFNNDPATTHEHILQVFDATILRLELMQEKRRSVILQSLKQSVGVLEPEIAQ